MLRYKIVMNGQGGYFFCSFIKKEIIDFWLSKKSIELLQEYVLAQYLQDEEIDDEWRIPEKFRFDIFNNINSLCLWESDSIILNNSTICDIYELEISNLDIASFQLESDFAKHKLVDSFLCTDKYLLNIPEHNWNALVLSLLQKYKVTNAYLIYFKVNARGYATHDEILKIQNPFNKSDLKFFTGDFGTADIKSHIIKKALYKPNSSNEKVLYDFRMFKSAKEKNDFDFAGLQRVHLINSKLNFNWIND